MPDTPRNPADARETPSRALRARMTVGAGLLIPGAANALTARVIEQAGFPALMVSGAAIANTYLGVPDIGLLTVTELANHVAAIREVVQIPLIVDADTGFGNALNVGRTIAALERAGANAIMIEDQTFPKRCGHFEGKQVIPLQEMVQKVRAAVDARRDPAMTILARTDARAVEGLARAVERVNAYREAGADVLFVEAPASLDELASIPREAPGVHICNMVIGGKTPVTPRAQLQAFGYGGIVYANTPLQAALLAMKKVLAHLQEHGSTAGIEEAIISFQERQRTVDFEHYARLERRYASD